MSVIRNPELRVAIYSPTAATITNPVTACNSETGEVFTYTGLFSTADECKYPDARVVAQVDATKLVLFVNGLGKLITPQAFESAVAGLSDEAYGRVLDAKGRFDTTYRGKKPFEFKL